MSTIARQYATDHLHDLPGVVLAREGRLWGVYAPSSQLSFDIAEDGVGRVRGFQRAAQILTWILLPLAIIGSVKLVRRSWPRFVALAIPGLVASINAAVFYGSTRLRVVAEPSLAVLAAMATVAVLRRLHHIWRTAEL